MVFLLRLLAKTTDFVPPARARWVFPLDGDIEQLGEKIGGLSLEPAMLFVR
jgi:hypothetical protein